MGIYEEVTKISGNATFIAAGNKLYFGDDASDNIDIINKAYIEIIALASNYQ